MKSTMTGAGNVINISNLQDGSTPTNNTNFESYYHNICATLQSKGEVHSVSKVFAQLPNDEDRVKFVLEHRLLTGSMTFQWWKDYNFVQKERGESQRLRNLGNQVYQKNKLNEALEYYNQSICLAPHPGSLFLFK